MLKITILGAQRAVIGALLCVLFATTVGATDGKPRLIVTATRAINAISGAVERLSQDHPGVIVDFYPILDADHAILRMVGLGEPTDVFVIPGSRFAQYVDAGFLQTIRPKLEVADEQFIQHVPPEMLIWGHRHGEPFCVYFAQLSSEPVYACVWRDGDIDVAWPFLVELIRWHPEPDDQQSFIRNYITKYFHERDFITVYRHVIHPDRKAEITGVNTDWTEAAFVQSSERILATYPDLAEISPKGRRAPCEPILLGDPVKGKTYGGDISQNRYTITYGGDPQSASDITIVMQSIGVNGTTKRLLFFHPEHRWEQWYEDAHCR